MKSKSARQPFRVRWWENDTSYAAIKDETGWRQFFEKEAGTVRWFEIQSTPMLVGRAETSLANGRDLQELPVDEDTPSIPEVHFYSCFISYSTNDQGFADQLNADLQSKGVRCWFAPHDIVPGEKILGQIDEAIRLYDRLLLILSEHSIRSGWVKTEIAKARKREMKENRRMLFPIRLVDFQALADWECFDADSGEDFAREIRQYFIPDFGAWKRRNSYREAFDRLLHALKAEDRTAQS